MIRWYYAHPKTRDQVGPCEEAEVRNLFVSGTIGPSTLVWHEGLAEWIPAREAFLAYDPELGPERAAVPGRLAGWLRFDSIMLWLLALVLALPCLAVAIPLAVAAWWCWSAAATIVRMPSIPAESEVVLTRLRGVFAGLGWTAIIAIVLMLAFVLLLCLGVLGPEMPEGGLRGLMEVLSSQLAHAAVPEG